MVHMKMCVQGSSYGLAVCEVISLRETTKEDTVGKKANAVEKDRLGRSSVPFPPSLPLSLSPCRDSCFWYLSSGRHKDVSSLSHLV